MILPEPLYKGACINRLILLLIFAFYSSVAYANEVVLANKSIYKPSFSFLAKALNPVEVSYFSIFTGPSFGNGKHPVNEFGDIQKESMSTWTQLSFQWEASEEYRFIANPRFVINHNSSEFESNRFEWDSPVFGIAGIWHRTEKFTFAGSINTSVPWLRSDGMREDGISFNPGGFNSVTYLLSSDWSIGSWIWARAFFYERSTVEEDNRLGFFLAPIVTHTVNDNLATSLFYRVNGNGRNRYDIGFETDMSLNFLVSYQLNQYLTLRPMVTLFQKADFKLPEGNFNLWLSGRLF